MIGRNSILKNAKFFLNAIQKNMVVVVLPDPCRKKNFENSLPLPRNNRKNNKRFHSVKSVEYGISQFLSWADFNIKLTDLCGIGFDF